MTKQFVLIIASLIIATTLLVGCVDTSGDYNYYNTHEPVSSDNYNLNCYSSYYENITVIDKTTEIVKSGWGARTSYVVVADDGVTREAVSFGVYRLLIPNNTYRVISTDRRGCGYAEHHVWI
jgi:hypothetical protein